MPTTLPETLNMERIVADYLRDAQDARVVHQTPDNQGAPWVRIVQLDAVDQAHEHVVLYMLQVECYAGGALGTDSYGGIPQAIALGATVRQRLKAMRDAELDDAVVSEVGFAGDARVPDRDLGGRERKILTALITAHPKP